MLQRRGSGDRDLDRKESISDLLHDSLVEFYETHDPNMVEHVDEIVETVGENHANFVILQDALEAQFGGGPADAWDHVARVLTTFYREVEPEALHKVAEIMVRSVCCCCC